MLVGPAGQLEILKPSASETILDASGCILPNRHKRRAGEVPGRAASFQVHAIQGPSRCSCGLPGFPQGCPHPRHHCCCQSIQVNLLNTGSKAAHTSTRLPTPFPMFFTVHLKLFFMPELISWLISFTATPTPIPTATASPLPQCICAS